MNNLSTPTLSRVGLKLFYMVQKLLDNNTPFAIVQYFETVRDVTGISKKVYELIYLNSEDELKFKIIDNKLALEIIPKLKKVCDTEDGCVWEFRNFKEYKDIILFN